MTVRNLTGTEHPEIEATGEWAALSARMTAAIDTDLLSSAAGSWGGRNDVVVSIVPGAGQGAPACFLPDLARIEINGDLLEVKPEHFDPSEKIDREDCAATWGLLTHEAAHVRFTDWTEEADAILRKAVLVDKTMTTEQAAQIQETAMMLEEPRIEAQQKLVRPGDERWLRCSAARHLVEDIAKNGVITVDSALTTLALVGGRQRNGIIMPSEGNAVLMAAREIVNKAKSRDDDPRTYGRDWLGADYSETAGTSRASRLLNIVEQATRMAHPTAKDMLDLASEWVSMLPDNAGKPQGRGAADLASALDDALKEMTEDIEGRGGQVPSPEDEDSSEARYKPQKWTPATQFQKRQAGLLAERLRDYLIPERTTRLIPSALPPGRLDMREAMAADGQADRGMIPDAKPWRRVSRRVNPTPPLRVGVAVDISGSMSVVEKHTWEIVYRMYSAFRELPDCDIEVQLAGVGTCRAKLQEGKIPTYSYNHGCERVDLAIAKLRHDVSLTRRGWARLLIVVSDAGFSQVEYEGSVRECKDLLRSECRVLWLDVGNGRGYSGGGPTVKEIVAAGGHYVALDGTPEQAAKMAEDELVKVVHDAAVALRRAR